MTINNQANLFKNILAALFFIFLLASFGICLYPEKPTQLLTNPEQTIFLTGSEKSKFNVNEVTQQYRQIRQSALENGGYMYRDWTPGAGIGPLKIQSSSFTAPRYMSVTVAGGTRTLHGLVKTYIECEKSGARIGIFSGSVNVNISEAIVATPANWCPGVSHLLFETTEKEAYVGVGAVYEIPPVSYWKSSLAGKLPYFVTALFIFSFLMFAGAAAANRFGWHQDPLPVAFVSLGGASLSIFYLSTVLNEEWRWTSPVAIAFIAIVLFFSAGSQARKVTAAGLLPHFKVWALIGLVYLAILSLGYNGLGHWEPNYRFWPAAWSSDAELPWLFAEGTRHGWNLRELLGGQWMPTDRPPLMTGALLLLSDAFGWLQINNDGNYLRGTAYNSASVALNTLWAPAILWLLARFAPRLNRNQFQLVLLFISCIPFVLFNSVYGWPKAFGAAFALVAFGLVCQTRPAPSINAPKKSAIILFPLVCAFSMLAHMSGALFVAPLGLLYLLWCFRREGFKQVIMGVSLALLVLGSWSMYKYYLLPSADPVGKYALTGSFGFGSDASLWKMLVDRYSTISLWQWLEIKGIMLAQAFVPVDHMVTYLHINSDYGANPIDKLRALDFMFLTVGNSGILVCCAVSLWLIFSSVRHKRAGALAPVMPFVALLLASMLTWLMIVVLFFAPPVLHHWPQAAIFGLALAGSVITQYRFPQFFKALLLILLAYTGIVWIVSPLMNALAIDATAAILLIVLLGSAFFYRESSLISVNESLDESQVSTQIVGA
jgi:hypothetical protein